MAAQDGMGRCESFRPRCECGTIFIANAVECRICGQQRVGVKARALRGASIGATVAILKEDEKLTGTIGLYGEIVDVDSSDIAFKVMLSSGTAWWYKEAWLRVFEDEDVPAGVQVRPAPSPAEQVRPAVQNKQMYQMPPELIPPPSSANVPTEAEPCLGASVVIKKEDEKLTGTIGQRGKIIDVDSSAMPFKVYLYTGVAWWYKGEWLQVVVPVPSDEALGQPPPQVLVQKASVSVASSRPAANTQAGPRPSLGVFVVIQNEDEKLTGTIGQCGQVVDTDSSSTPWKVKLPSGAAWWYKAEWLQVAEQAEISKIFSMEAAGVRSNDEAVANKAAAEAAAARQQGPARVPNLPARRPRAPKAHKMMGAAVIIKREDEKLTGTVGQYGEVVDVDNSNMPIKVQLNDGVAWWYKEEWLQMTEKRAQPQGALVGSQAQVSPVIATEAKALGRPSFGAYVVVAEEDEKLTGTVGQCGKVIDMDSSSMPFKVQFANDDAWWYKEEWLQAPKVERAVLEDKWRADCNAAKQQKQMAVEADERDRQQAATGSTSRPAFSTSSFKASSRAKAHRLFGASVVIKREDDKLTGTVGQYGEVVDVDNSAIPFKVRLSDGVSWWYKQEWLEVVAAGSAAAAAAPQAAASQAVQRAVPAAPQHSPEDFVSPNCECGTTFLPPNRSDCRICGEQRPLKNAAKNAAAFAAAAAAAVQEEERARQLKEEYGRREMQAAQEAERDRQMKEESAQREAQALQEAERDRQMKEESAQREAQALQEAERERQMQEAAARQQASATQEAERERVLKEEAARRQAAAAQEAERERQLQEEFARREAEEQANGQFEAAERDRRLKEEAARLQAKAAEEAERNRQLQDEAARQQAAATQEAERARQAQEDAARQQALAIQEAERARQTQEGAARQQALAIQEAERERQMKEADARRQDLATQEAERERQLKEEYARQQAAAKEEAEREFQLKLNAARKEAAAAQEAQKDQSEELAALRQEAESRRLEEERQMQEAQKEMQDCQKAAVGRDFFAQVLGESYLEIVEPSFVVEMPSSRGRSASPIRTGSPGVPGMERSLSPASPRYGGAYSPSTYKGFPPTAGITTAVDSSLMGQQTTPRYATVLDTTVGPIIETPRSTLVTSPMKPSSLSHLSSLGSARSPGIFPPQIQSQPPHRPYSSLRMPITRRSLTPTKSSSAGRFANWPSSSTVDFTSQNGQMAQGIQRMQSAGAAFAPSPARIAMGQPAR